MIDYVDWQVLFDSQILLETSAENPLVAQARKRIEEFFNLLLKNIKQIIDDPQSLPLSQRIQGKITSVANWFRGKKQNACVSYEDWLDDHIQRLTETCAAQLLLLEDWQGVEQAVASFKASILQILNQVAKQLPGDVDSYDPADAENQSAPPTPNSDTERPEEEPSVPPPFTAQVSAGGPTYQYTAAPPGPVNPMSELGKPDFIPQLVARLQNKPTDDLENAVDNGDHLSILNALAQVDDEFDWASLQPFINKPNVQNVITRIADEVLNQLPNQKMAAQTGSQERSAAKAPVADMATVKDHIKKMNLSSFQMRHVLNHLLSKAVGKEGMNDPVFQKQLLMIQNVSRPDDHTKEQLKKFDKLIRKLEQGPLLNIADYLAKNYDLGENIPNIKNIRSLLKAKDDKVDSVRDILDTTPNVDVNQIADQLNMDVKEVRKIIAQIKKNKLLPHAESFGHYQEHPTFLASRVSRLLGEENGL